MFKAAEEVNERRNFIVDSHQLAATFRCSVILVKIVLLSSVQLLCVLLILWRKQFSFLFFYFFTLSPVKSVLYFYTPFHL